ncbi:MAG: hypothetical protein SGJ20_20025, partial [Planctomycetota bacterium]|nr:hypothetical protein [Planctomycetota bacterium]
MLKKICLGLAIVGLLQFTSADAAVVVVSEGIYETGIIGRDFTRIRTKDGVDTIETNDATIIAQNNIDNDFGVYNGDNVTYTHQLG